ncbi:MAG: hypothetical protein V3V75_06685, partial [Thermoguttaceae bacterium]
PTSGKLVAIVTVPDLVGTDTHFWGGHTIPCEGTDCPAHQEGVPFRWHAYLAAITWPQHLHFLFECTAAAAENFVMYRKAHGSLLGCGFVAERLHHRPNGRVLIRCKPADIEHIKLPKPPNLIICLENLWQLKRNTLATSGIVKETDHLHVDRDRLAQAARGLDPDPLPPQE